VPVSADHFKQGRERLLDKGVETLLRRFNDEKGNLVEQEERDKFLNLIKKEDLYMADPYYLGRRQTNLNWSMRSILIDWMMHVLKEY
jgi:hypothetical protein